MGWNQPTVTQRQDPWAGTQQSILNTLLQLGAIKFGANLQEKANIAQAGRETQALELMKETKPDAPEGLFAYWTGKGWSVTSKPTPPTLKGEKFHWRYDSQQQRFVKTPVPVEGVKAGVKYLTDEGGNVTKVVTDRTGSVTSQKSLGAIGKPGKSGTEINVGDIATKISATASAKDIAFLQSPKFRASVQDSVAKINKHQWMIADPAERADMMREEADKRVRVKFPNAQFGEGDEGLGWYVKQGEGYIKVVPWGE